MINKQKGYRTLMVWQKANQMALEVYNKTKNFPKEELYGLTSQLRRAAFSVPINIVEGHASSSKREFLNFLNIANRSLVETEYLLEICCDIQFLHRDEYEKLEEVRQEVAIMLRAFMNSIRSKL